MGDGGTCRCGSQSRSAGIGKEIQDFRLPFRMAFQRILYQSGKPVRRFMTKLLA